MTRKWAYTLDRREAVTALLEGRGEALVVTGLGATTYDVYASGDHPGNFYLWNAMGGAAMVGLGLALAQPTRRVLVVTGDGEQMMGLGALVTVGVAAKPENLGIVVIDNGHYGETGMQAGHTRLGADLGAIARGAGFRHVFEASDLAGVRSLCEALSSTSGPIFAVIRVRAENPPRSLPSRDVVLLKHRIRTHLGVED